MTQTGLKAEEKNIVLPGDVLAEGIDYVSGKGTYRKDDKILSLQVGMFSSEGRVLKVIPLSGRYIPKLNDTIIARVTNITMSGWIIDTNSAYQGMLGLKDGTDVFVPKGSDLRKYFDIGDYIVCKIINLTSQKLIDVSTKGSNIRKLGEGRIIKVTPSKVPRIIGKAGSMINAIKERTNSKVIVGQNGVIWLKNDDPILEVLTVETFEFIEENAHKSGLTDKVSLWLDEKVKKLGIKLKSKELKKEDLAESPNNK